MFFLNLSTLTTAIPETQLSDNSFRAWCLPGGIMKAEINFGFESHGKICIYNLTGQLLFSVNIPASGRYELNPGLKDGIYVISFETRHSRTAKKVFFRN